MITLNEDLSGQDRIPKNLAKFLTNNSYYYVDNYPIRHFDLSTLGTDDWNISLKTVNKVINLDYKLITTKNVKLKRFVTNIVDVIQSVDRFGIKAAICLNSKTNAHPGNKRLIVARYLGKTSVPVIGHRDFFEDNFKQMYKIDKVNDLYQIFGEQISVRITTKNHLEVFYHGESQMRDVNGMDNFAKKAGLIRAQNKVCPDISDYLLQNGLEIVCRFDKITETNRLYKTFYSQKPTNKIYIEILDDTILCNKFNFWKLFFHFDYENRIKICKGKKLKLVNKLSLLDNVIDNCSLFTTLTRQKTYV